ASVGTRVPATQTSGDTPIGALGSGSDYTVFLQHLGIPATDISSTGSYGVYHSAFDNFNWFKKFGDPDFLYEQQMARLFGLEILRMADADILPLDYQEYGDEVGAYIDAAKKKAQTQFGVRAVNFDSADRAAQRFAEAGAKILREQKNPHSDAESLNEKLRRAERALLIPGGLPN